MGGSFKIGRALGIDVKVHWTFFLLLAFFAFVGYGATGAVAGALVMVAVILALFVCVLLHEFGHSVAAQRLGIKVRDITLLPLGGVARLDALPEKAVDEIKIALAGPLVNVGLAPLFFGAGLLLGADAVALDPRAAQGSFGGFLAYLGLVNVSLVAFNMIPAFPLDGGRVLRGLLATRLGPVRATEVSAAVGQVFAAGFFLVGLLGGNFFLVLIAVFVFFGASGEAEMVRQRELARDLLVADVMGARAATETVTPDHGFGRVLDLAVHGYQEDFPVVDVEGRLVGIVTRDEILAAARSPDTFRFVRDLMREDLPTVTPGSDLFADGYRTLRESGLRAVPVTENGELVGMLTVEDLAQASLVKQLPKQQL